jgi:hypothetical protein
MFYARKSRPLGQAIPLDLSASERQGQRFDEGFVRSGGARRCSPHNMSLGRGAPGPRVSSPLAW